MCAVLLLWVCVCMCFNQTCWEKFWVESHPTWFQMFFLLLQSERKPMAQEKECSNQSRKSFHAGVSVGMKIL